MIANLLQDLSFTFRLLRKSPGFTLAAVLTLGVGIGINVAIYSVVHAVLLSELPYPEPERLVAITETAGGSVWPTSYPDYLDWRAAQHSFDEIAVSRRDDFNLTGDGEPERISGLFVTASYFRVLQAPPKLGRLFFDEEDSVPGVNPVVLSEHLWRSRFAGDPAIVGRKLILNTINYEVVGVAADNLAIVRNPETSRNTQGARNADLYAPFGFYANRPYMHDRNSRLGFYSIGRLKQGVSIEQAATDLKVIARNLELKYPASNTDCGVAVSSLHDSVIGKYRAMLWLLETAVALVLLITCANIANLLLVRTAAREKEIAVRAALGASRARILAQLLTESVVLAFIGGAPGCLLAFWSKDAITSLSPHDFPRLQEIRLDLPVFAFSALITLVASVVFGLGPAWRLSKAELSTVAKSVGGSHPHRSLGLLIVGQVAFACVLLTGAGLLTQTFLALGNEPLGFNPSHLLTAGIKLPGLKYHEPIDQATFFQQLLEKVEALPGVKAAAVDDDVPFSGFRAQETFAVTGQPEPRHGEEPSAETHCVSPDYFRTMGIPMLRGRSFGPDDVLGKPFVIVIDEYLARKFFPGRDPIGQQLNQQLEPGQADKPRAHYTIVGIVPSVRHGEVGIAPKIPQIYWPAAQFSGLQTTLLVRTEGDPVALLPSVRAAVRSIDSQLPIFAARTMEQAVAASIGTQRLSATLIGGFSILALFLAALGLYGVLAYSVTQRTREIGIRIALGSPRANIFGLIVRRAMIMVGLGIFVGVVLALSCGPLIQHFVYGVTPHDTLTIVGAAILLVGIAILACLLPALRAIRVDPMVALRQD
ncbi:MAG TPA: ABC transporter permease [Chthoniobacterales bacterium]|nr:ABC transporter permease [Chthoniobacterales bacterium]